MDAARPQVLLIEENARGSMSLARRLQDRGCECWFATSYREAFALLNRYKFDLVLSQTRLHGEPLHPLIDYLDGSSTTLYFSFAVENGCWWLPGLQRGKYCFGSAALRPGEFERVLEEFIAGMRVVASAPEAGVIAVAAGSQQS